MVFVGFVIADPADYTIFDTFGLYAYQAERLAGMELSLAAFRVLEGVACRTHYLMR